MYARSTGFEADRLRRLILFSSLFHEGVFIARRNIAVQVHSQVHLILDRGECRRQHALPDPCVAEPLTLPSLTCGHQLLRHQHSCRNSHLLAFARMDLILGANRHPVYQRGSTRWSGKGCVLKRCRNLRFWTDETRVLVWQIWETGMPHVVWCVNMTLSSGTGVPDLLLHDL